MKKSRLRRTLSSIKIYILLILLFFITSSFFYSYYYKTPMYIATAKMEFGGKSKTTMSVYARQIAEEETLEKIIQNYNLGISTNELSNSISINVDINAKFVEVSVKDENNSRAAIIANELINKLKEKNKDAFESNVNAVKKAEVPKEAYNINHIKEMGYPTAFGVCICILIIIITYIKNLIYDIYLYFKNRKNRDDIDDNNSQNMVYDNLQRMRNVYDNTNKDEYEEDDDEEDNEYEEQEDNDKNYYNNYETNKKMVVEKISTTQKSISKQTQQNMNKIRYLDPNINKNKSQIILKN